MKYYLDETSFKNMNLKEIEFYDKNYKFYQQAKEILKEKNISQIKISELIDIIKTSYLLNDYKQLMNDFNTKILYKSDIHGINHNIRVAFYTFIISTVEKISKDDFKIVIEAAKYHDVGRINDREDKTHGQRSSESLHFLKNKYSDEELNILKSIIECHSLNDDELINITNKNKVKDFDRCKKLLEILKDSDGLDRVRLEYPFVNVDFIRTNTAKKLILLSYEIYNNYYYLFKIKGKRKIKTSSYFTWIIETKNDKYVRQYKRTNKTIHGYPRTIPTHKIMKLINNSNIYAPKLLRNRLKYIDQEFINGIQINDEYDKQTIQNIIINYIIEMNKVNYTKINKYIKWKNNTEYLYFLINHLEKVKQTFSSKTNKILNTLNIDEKLNELKNIKLDNTRKLTLIHGDIHNGNMIDNNGNIYLLDWELATVGDLAYELATHFILMQYTDTEQKYFINNLSKELNIDKQLLKKDVNVYMIYELLRRIYLRFNKIDKLIINNKNIEKEVNDLYEHYTQLLKLVEINTLPFEKIMEVFYE